MDLKRIMTRLKIRISIFFAATFSMTLLASMGFLYYKSKFPSFDFDTDAICGDHSAYQANPSGFESNLTFETIYDAGFESFRPALASDPAGRTVEERVACSIVFSTGESEQGGWDSFLNVAILAQSDEGFKECDNENRSLKHRSEDSESDFQTSNSDLADWENETIAYGTRFSTSGQVHSAGVSEADVELISCNSDLNIRIGVFHDPKGDDSKFDDDLMLEFVLELREHTLEAISS